MAFLTSLLRPVLAFMSTWLAGRSAGLNAAKIEELKGYAETSKRIDKVGPIDAAAAAEWLRQRAKH